MKNETMTAQEAWEEVERLKIDVSYSHVKGDWYAMTIKPEIQVAFSTGPIEAIEALLAKIAQSNRLNQRVADAIEKAEATFAGLAEPL